MTSAADGPPPGKQERSLAKAAGSASAIMAGSLFLSRALGVLRDTFIASRFGLLEVNDSYRIATQIPDMIFMLIAGGGLSSAFIPVFSEFWYTNRKKEAWKAFSVVVTICSIGAVALIIGAWFLSPAIVHMYGKAKPAVIGPAIEMSRILLPAQFAFLIGSIMLGTLYARKQFLGPGLAPNIYNLGIIVGATLLPVMFHTGIIGVAWGALGGAFVGNIILPMLMMIPQGGSFRLSLDVHAPGVSKFFKLLLPVILGFSLPSMVSLVTQYFGSGFGSGSNTVLSCSNNLMQAPLGIFGQSFALGIFPLLSQLFAEKKMDLYRDMLARTLRTVLYFAVASAALMFALAPLVVKIIYGYGKATGESGQLDLIATSLRIYCVAIPAWCLQPCLMRGFFSLHKTLKPIAYGTAMTLFFIVCCAFLQFPATQQTTLALTSAIPGIGGVVKHVLHSDQGLLRLPWATDIAAVLLVVILFVTLEGEIGKMSKRAVFDTFLKCLVAAVPAGGLAYLAMGFVPSGRKILAIFSFLALLFVFCLIYVTLTKLFKMAEAESMVQRARHFGQRFKKALGRK
jgi:putative peptidoglycan lipid II flippase